MQLVPITNNVVSFNHVHGEVYLLHYVTKFVSDLRQVYGFLQVLRFPPPIKLDITEILLKVVLNTIPLTLTPFKPIIRCAKSWNTELNMLLSLE